MSGGCVKMIAVGGFVILCLVLSGGQAQYTYEVDLNDFADANMEYFQVLFPLKGYLDGRMLYGEADTPGAIYTNVTIMSTEDLGRVGNFKQMVDLSSMVNNLTGTVSTPRMSIHVGEVYSPTYFGPFNMKNVTVDLVYPEFDIQLSIHPSSGVCVLSFSVFISISEAILYTDIPFADNRNITEFVDRTLISYINKIMSSETVNMTPGHCDPVSAYLTLSRSISTVSHQSLQQFMETRKNKSL